MKIKSIFLISIFLLIGWKPACGFDLLKGVMPGDVSSLHEKVEGQCLKCHTIGQKSFFDKCVACHKEVKKNVDQKSGYHGKIDVSKCEACHNEHRGRSNGMIMLESAGFDHKKTDYLLEGKHQKADCNKCHTRRKYRETPHPCEACHLKNDRTHKGALGKECGQCHNPKEWKDAKFDHGKTKFALEGKHQPLICEKCHTPENFKSIPRECIFCHKKDDKHKGSLGQTCEKCHSAISWKEIKFDHDKTHFPLEGGHRATPCNKCHTLNNFKNTPKECYSCHKKDDKHKGILGKECQTCHSADTWKKSSFNHDKFEFKLIGFHQKTDCLKCHKNSKVKETPKRCYDCHKKDDYHNGKLGEKCDRCHMIVEKWKEFEFDHSRTKFPLLAKHVPVTCAKCHVKDEYKIPVTCVSCHLKDDKHQGKLGDMCEKCHTEKSWKDVTRFDHRKTDFPLEGKHIDTKCKECHKTQIFKDTTKICLDCHKKDDKHKGLFGKKCEFCHSPKTWERKDFNHFRETNYPLLDKHSQVKCPECHTRPLFLNRTSRMCVSCHKLDDIHEGELGSRCEICHSEVGFRVIKKAASFIR